MKICKNIKFLENIQTPMIHKLFSTNNSCKHLKTLNKGLINWPNFDDYETFDADLFLLN